MPFKPFKLFNANAVLQAMILVLNARQGQLVKGILERDSNVLDSNPTFQVDCTEVVINKKELYWIVSVDHGTISFVSRKTNLKNKQFVEKETYFDSDGSITHKEKIVSRSGKTSSTMDFTKDTYGNMNYVINHNVIKIESVN